VATRGYVGVGFSPTGGMRGADIILGWVDEAGQPYLSDRHGTGDRTPLVDASQDVVLLHSSQNETHTTLRFRRPLRPCDPLHDLPITSSTMRVIWAYDSNTSLASSMSSLPYHDHRGTASLYMMGDERLDYSRVQHVQTWDVLAPNVSLPNDVDTLYWCKMYKMPALDKKHHFIGYEPHIADHMVPYVHHMILYECHAPGVNSSYHFDQWIDQVGAQCYAANMPESWNGCNMPLVVWAVGSRGFALPQEAGFPLGEEHNGATYFMLEIHYSNPSMIQDLVDSSGVRIFHTPKLRQYDAGVLQFGHNVEPFQIIPPSTVWKTTGHCHSECTRLTLPASGIHIFSGALHAHVLGTSIALQHIRDGVELPPVVEDGMYDFNYQQERVLQQFRTVLPGDHLIVTCGYDASNKHATTYGGFKTTDEMCLVFASYYPRQRLTECHSRPDVALLLDTLGITDMRDNSAVLNGFQMRSFDISNVNTDREQSRITKMMEQPQAGASYNELILAYFFSMMIIDAPKELNGTTLLDFLNDRRTWQNTTVLRTLQERVTTGQYEPQCVYSGRIMPSGMPKKAKYPQYAPYVRAEEPCNRVSGLSTAAVPSVHSPSMVNHRVEHNPSPSSVDPHQPFGYPPTVSQESSLYDQRSTNIQHGSFGYQPTVNQESTFRDHRRAHETTRYQNPSVLQDDVSDYLSIVTLGSSHEGDGSSSPQGDVSSLQRGDGPSLNQHSTSHEDIDPKSDLHSPLHNPSLREESSSFGDDIAAIHEQLLKDVNNLDVTNSVSYSHPDNTREGEEEHPAGVQGARRSAGGSRGEGEEEEGMQGGGEVHQSKNWKSSAPGRPATPRYLVELVAFILTLFVV
ncbi:Copper type II ascorbate-dependent monooxygenase N-terminal, partial [Trinorchestia longiramus]